MWEIPVEGGTALLAALSVGAVLGAFYDVFRLLRLAFRHHWLTIFLEDLLFCTVAAVSVFLLLLEGRNGGIRMFLLAGVAGGFFLWYHTVGLLLVSLADWIFAFFRLCLRGVIYLLFKPPALLVGMVIKQKEKREGYRKKVKKGEKKGENPLEKHAPHGV